MVEDIVRPRGRYSLALTARSANDATRHYRDGVLVAVLTPAGRPELVAAGQLADGRIRLRAGTEAGVDLLRFCLAVDDDHTEFLRRFDSDAVLGETVRQLGGLRQLRVPTVAQALLRALCGQLIESSRARSIERRIIRAATPAHGGLHAPPTCDQLGAFSAADLRRLGLHARRAATLSRLCRSIDLERLREVAAPSAAARLGRERGLGPWSVGVVSLEGLGSSAFGLVGDLGLIKLQAAMRGYRAEGGETAELLEPYGEWAGLASVYLLAGWKRGLLPVPRRERRAA